jgi:hypothetical protein
MAVVVEGDTRQQTGNSRQQTVFSTSGAFCEVLRVDRSPLQAQWTGRDDLRVFKNVSERCHHNARMELG